jgi:TPR repeat protein
MLYNLLDIYRGDRMKKGIILVLFVFLNASYLTQNFVNHCNSGNKISCAILGLMYFTGENVKKDIKKSIKYYKRACFLKEKNSCFKLYEYYKDKNVKLANVFLKQACKYYNKKACVLLNKNHYNDLLSVK